MYRKILRSVAVALAGMMSLVAVASPAQAASAQAIPAQAVPLASLLPTAPVAQADRQVPNPSAVPAVSAAAWGYWLKNDANSGLCLDGSATKGVRWATCSTTSLYQQWNVSGNYIFNYYYCLDGAVANGVRANDCNGSDWQSWYSVGDNLHNWAYLEERSLDGSASQGIRMNTTDYSSKWQQVAALVLPSRRVGRRSGWSWTPGPRPPGPPEGTAGESSERAAGRRTSWPG